MACSLLIQSSFLNTTRTRGLTASFHPVHPYPFSPSCFPHLIPSLVSTTASGLPKDSRDTPMRRTRHRDGRLLKGGVGLTTGLGWSDRLVFTFFPLARVLGTPITVVSSDQPARSFSDHSFLYTAKTKMLLLRSLVASRHSTSQDVLRLLPYTPRPRILIRNLHLGSIPYLDPTAADHFMTLISMMTIRMVWMSLGGFMTGDTSARDLHRLCPISSRGNLN